MFSIKAMIKAPRETPVLLTFRRRIQKGEFAGSHEFKMVCILRVKDTYPVWEWLKHVRLLACDKAEFSWWLFEDSSGNLDGYACINLQYLQTIEIFPEQDLPLLLGWPRRYPLIEEFLRGTYEPDPIAEACSQKRGL